MDERVLRLPYIQIFYFFVDRDMPDESCRQCGGSLLDYAQCAECKKIIRMICKSCRTKTIEQFHSECLPALNTPKNIPNNVPCMTLA